MQRRPARSGYTLIETIVAVLLFSLGGLALASTSAVIGRALNTDGLRERAARVAASRLEAISAECRTATSGREAFEQIDSEWSVSFPAQSQVSVVEAVSYITEKGRRTDFYRAILPCPG
jgi:prepilin-type N-terminal cleavage/methylation domain-containing protein